MYTDRADKEMKTRYVSLRFLADTAHRVNMLLRNDLQEVIRRAKADECLPFNSKGNNPYAFFSDVPKETKEIFL